MSDLSRAPGGHSAASSNGSPQALVPLEALQDQLDRIQRVSRTGSWHLDLDRDVLTWTAESYRMFGISPGEPLTFASLLEHVHPADREHVDASWKAAVAGEPYDVVHRLRNGTEERWVRSRAELLRDANGRLVSVVGTIQDITDLKTIESQLRQAREQAEHVNRVLRATQAVNRLIVRERERDTLARQAVKLLVELGRFPVAWLVLTPDGEPPRVFEAGMAAPGRDDLASVFSDGRYPPCVLRAHEQRDAVHSTPGSCDGCELCPAPLQLGGLTVGLVHESRNFGYLTVVRGKDAVAPEEELALLAPIADDLAYALDAVRVGTERKRIERLLVETERLADVGGWEWDFATDEFTFTYQWMAIHGVSRSSMTRRQLMELAHPDDRARVEAAMTACLESGEPYDLTHRIRRADTGETRVVSAHGELITGPDGPAGMVGAATDVTRGHETEEQLRFQARMLEAIGESVIATDPAGRVVYWNPAAERLYGWTAEEAMGRSILELTPVEDERFAADEVMAQVTRGNRWSGEFNVRRKDGSTFVASVSNTPVLGVDGELEAVIGISTDLTEQKAREQELEEMRLWLETAVAAGAVGLWDWDLATDQMTYSREWKRQIGYEDHEVEDSFDEWEKRVHPEDLAPIMARIQEFLQSDEESFDVEFRFRHREGHYLSILTHATAVRDDDGAPVRLVGSHVDITHLREAEEERRAMELQLEQTQRLEAIGRLAGGVAHDFNNALTVIFGVSELALADLDPDSPRVADFEEIRSAAEHARGMTQQLLGFARRQVVAPEPLILNDVIEDRLRILRRLIGENIELVWRPGHELWWVEIDPVQVEQVLTNLLVNARDAIGDIGTVTIETDNQTLDEAYHAAHPGTEPGEYVCMTVTDDGSGMDAETLSNIFEPFYTTKEDDEGTGLGLATVYGIARQNDGFVHVYSEPGQGATFRVYLPRLTEPGATEPDGEATPRLERGTETVLVVEDEEGVRRFLVRVLERQGYSVVEAATPGEAIQRVLDGAVVIDVLLTDVVMPEMNGRELWDAVRDLRPEIRCLFMSGYTAEVITHRGILDEGVHFIQKPMAPRELTAKVRELLDDG